MVALYLKKHYRLATNKPCRDQLAGTDDLSWDDCPVLRARSDSARRSPADIVASRISLTLPSVTQPGSDSSLMVWSFWVLIPTVGFNSFNTASQPLTLTRPPRAIETRFGSSHTVAPPSVHKARDACSHRLRCAIYRPIEDSDHSAVIGADHFRKREGSAPVKRSDCTGVAEFTRSQRHGGHLLRKVCIFLEGQD